MLKDFDYDANQICEVGEVENTLEFDWIRQFYVQGSVHEVCIRNLIVSESLRSNIKHGGNQGLKFF